MYTKISDYVTCYNPYCIAIHIAYDTITHFVKQPILHMTYVSFTTPYCIQHPCNLSKKSNLSYVITQNQSKKNTLFIFYCHVMY